MFRRDGMLCCQILCCSLSLTATKLKYTRRKYASQSPASMPSNSMSEVGGEQSERDTAICMQISMGLCVGCECMGRSHGCNFSHAVSLRRSAVKVIRGITNELEIFKLHFLALGTIYLNDRSQKMRTRQLIQWKIFFRNIQQLGADDNLR